MNIVFFGSFQHYSALILESLITRHQALGTISAVVTTAPTANGKNPVHTLADQHSIPVITPEDLHDERAQPDAFRQSSTRSGKSDGKEIDLFLTAGYGKILPPSWLNYPKLGSLNLHFSLLPKYRGANPAEWAIMCGETTTGISLIKMNQQLDGGDILAQAEIPIDPTDTRETLYQKLYSLGADKLPTWLIEWQEFEARSRTPRSGSEHLQISVREQPKLSNSPYAARLRRADGFIPWSVVTKFLHGQTLTVTDFPSPHLQSALSYSLGTRHQSPATFLSSLPLALSGYPTLWTIVPTKKGNKRMKILSFQAPGTNRQALDYVQLEGQQPAHFNQIKNLIV